MVGCEPPWDPRKRNDNPWYLHYPMGPEIDLVHLNLSQEHQNGGVHISLGSKVEDNNPR